MKEFTALIGPADDDGYCAVAILEANYGEGDAVVQGRYSLRSDQVNQWVEQELAILNDPNRGKLCEHGLDLGLCAGPQHYPDERWEEGY